jgi:hypothetical protein
MPRRIKRSCKNSRHPFFSRLLYTNKPEMKNISDMKKVLLKAKKISKPIQRWLSMMGAVDPVK